MDENSMNMEISNPMYLKDEEEDDDRGYVTLGNNVNDKLMTFLWSYAAAVASKHIWDDNGDDDGGGGDDDDDDDDDDDECTEGCSWSFLWPSFCHHYQLIIIIIFITNMMLFFWFVYLKLLLSLSTLIFVDRFLSVDSELHEPLSEPLESSEARVFLLIESSSILGRRSQRRRSVGNRAVAGLHKGPPERIALILVEDDDDDDDDDEGEQGRLYHHHRRHWFESHDDDDFGLEMHLKISMTL